MSREALIAVIDDDDSFRGALIDCLDSLGYEVRGFPCAEDFIAWDDEQGSCNCVITDIRMPGMSGLDLKGLLATRGSTVPVIMISAHADRKLEARVEASGAVCLLRKPFETDALIDSLGRALKV